MPHRSRIISRDVRSISERSPGPKWQNLFEEMWPAYHRWFLVEGERARPTYADCVRRLHQHMPELMPVYEELVDLGGGGDHVARMLSMYRPSPYLTGCSQLVWTRGEPLLIRNYDYRPDLWEAVVLRTRWLGRDVVVMSDCLWGALDGINSDGLVVSLTFGGRKVVGDGFGIPLVLRYILETCTTAKEAAAVLNRIPAHMAYNVSVLDAEGDYVTAYVSPGHVTIFRQWPVSTNHQETVDWKEYVEATESLKREEFLSGLVEDDDLSAEALRAKFFEPPLFSRNYSGGHGTIYTAVYRPERRDVVFIWPTHVLQESPRRFTERTFTVRFEDVPHSATTLPTPWPLSGQQQALW